MKEETKLNKYGNPIFTYPDMRESNYKFIEKYLSKDKNLLEFGSGGSTVYFSKKVKKIISIEHDPYWVQQVSINLKKEGIDNVSLFYAPPNKPFELGETPKTQRQIEFYDYIRTPDSIKKNFPNFSYDVVFIDGRARIECAKYIFPFLHKDTVVILHDYKGRQRYRAVLEWYDEIDRIDKGCSAIALKRKSKIIEKYFPELLNSTKKED